MDIDWDLLVHYLAGASTVEEQEEFERWLGEAPEHRAVVQGARVVVAQARYDVPAGRAAELLASLRRDLATAEETGRRAPVLRVLRGDDRPTIMLLPSVRRSWWGVVAKAAAAVLLLVGGAALWRDMSPSPARQAHSTTTRERVTARGQRSAFRLPDGSEVVLAPESRLRLSSTYGKRDRTVSLVGEAAFTVTHDETRPFTVRTARGVAQDLGTRFVVHSYENDSSAVVVVAAGAVELRGPLQRAGAGVRLTRGQLGQLGPGGVIAVRSDVDLDRYFAWTEGRLVFRDTTLGEVVASLARWYDIDVRLGSDALAGRRLTASARDEPAGDVLRMVAVSLNLDLETSNAGRVYTLRAR